MKLQVADFYFDCQNISASLRDFCAAFQCSNSPRIDCTIQISEEDVAKERALASPKERESIARYLFEGMALYRKICAFALSKNAFLIHGVAIDYLGQGFLFTAPSGTGKTTHVRQWKKAFGKENVTIVNGDKPILRFIDGKVYAYGTPWNGKEHYGTTGRVALDGICFVQRGAENAIRKLSVDEALPKLFSQIMITDSSDLAKQMELVDQLVQLVPMYQVECTISEEAAIVAWKGMQNGKLE